jgi:hypothetical protein
VLNWDTAVRPASVRALSRGRGGNPGPTYLSLVDRAAPGLAWAVARFVAPVLRSSPWRGRADGPSAAVAERRCAIAISGRRAGSPAASIAERSCAVAVGGDRADRVAASISECSLLARFGRCECPRTQENDQYQTHWKAPGFIVADRVAPDLLRAVA